MGGRVPSFGEELAGGLGRGLLGAFEIQGAQRREEAKQREGLLAQQEAFARIRGAESDRERSAEEFRIREERAGREFQAQQESEAANKVIAMERLVTEAERGQREDAQRRRDAAIRTSQAHLNDIASTIENYDALLRDHTRWPSQEAYTSGLQAYQAAVQSLVQSNQEAHTLYGDEVYSPTGLRTDFPAERPSRPISANIGWARGILADQQASPEDRRLAEGIIASQTARLNVRTKADAWRTITTPDSSERDLSTAYGILQDAGVTPEQIRSVTDREPPPGYTPRVTGRPATPINQVEDAIIEDIRETAGGDYQEWFRQRNAMEGRYASMEAELGVLRDAQKNRALSPQEEGRRSQLEASMASLKNDYSMFSMYLSLPQSSQSKILNSLSDGVAPGAEQPTTGRQPTMDEIIRGLSGARSPPPAAEPPPATPGFNYTAEGLLKAAIAGDPTAQATITQIDRAANEGRPGAAEIRDAIIQEATRIREATRTPSSVPTIPTPTPRETIGSFMREAIPPSWFQGTPTPTPRGVTPTGAVGGETGNQVVSGVREAGQPPSVTRQPLPAAEQPAQRTITVRRGETLSSIARRELGNANRWKEIAALNRITDPRRLQKGQTLILPER